MKNFEDNLQVLPQVYMVVRIDGRGFTKFCDLHEFEKPNDYKAVDVMNKAAEYVVSKFEDVFLAYGQSDEYSFAFSKECQLFERRREKIVSTVVSMFTAAYVSGFQTIYGKPLKELPSFDARLVAYPTLQLLADYFSWR